MFLLNTRSSNYCVCVNAHGISVIICHAAQHIPRLRASDVKKRFSNNTELFNICPKKIPKFFARKIKFTAKKKKKNSEDQLLVTEWNIIYV